MPLAPWRIVRASVTGTSHAGMGASCQDFSTHELIDLPASEPVLIAAVSDGAGSAKHSAIGSLIACDTIVELVRVFLSNGGLVSQIDRSRAEDWMDGVANAITRHAQVSNHQVADYSCTLLASIVAEDAAAFIQIGDGAIVISHGVEDGWAWVFWPQKGQFANTTNFVVSDDARQLFAFDLAPRRIDELALFTDGLETLVLHQATRVVHEPFFNNVFKPVRASVAVGLDEGLSGSLERYLSSKAVCDRTNDDKTLLIATRNLITTEAPVTSK